MSPAHAVGDAEKADRRFRGPPEGPDGRDLPRRLEDYSPREVKRPGCLESLTPLTPDPAVGAASVGAAPAATSAWAHRAAASVPAAEDIRGLRRSHREAIFAAGAAPTGRGRQHGRSGDATYISAGSEASGRRRTRHAAAPRAVSNGSAVAGSGTTVTSSKATRTGWLPNS